MEKIEVTYSFENSVANIVLNDGKGNVLDHIMMGELLDTLTEVGHNQNIKLIVFEGAGKHFSFGASVEEHVKDQAELMLNGFHNLFYKIIDLGIPTLAKISGMCLGGGLELALVSNILYADKTAILGQPEIVLGVFPPPASIILPLKIGNAKAEELLITGRNFTADEGQKLGLINEVFDKKEDMNKAVDTWIEKHILPKSASSLKYAVKASRTTFNYIMQNKLPFLQNMYVNQLMETKDANEGINAFIEKRKPQWENC